MRKVEVKEAVAYNAPGHFDMRAIRLHSKEESGCENFTLGMSHFLPGGGTEYVEPPVELIYFILEGEMTVSDKDGNEICTLKKHDSMHFDAGEGKSILNKTNYPATMLVIASMLPANAK
ncbi:MAG TPA: cupin domain-containing protein [Candidatus Eubacterium avistercoris]|uniref:Cupin domain-containing protein n=1 Tax=Candidatus Eubacterium avistercoris TaxID=2838567 RepID=A0A9D2D270_9FIRM|nr:cupin domain-containing protein [Candidatus Eubacterium avistercoris]